MVLVLLPASVTEREDGGPNRFNVARLLVRLAVATLGLSDWLVDALAERLEEGRCRGEGRGKCEHAHLGTGSARGQVGRGRDRGHATDLPGCTMCASVHTHESRSRRAGVKMWGWRGRGAPCLPKDGRVAGCAGTAG